MRFILALLRCDELTNFVDLSVDDPFAPGEFMGRTQDLDVSIDAADGLHLARLCLEPLRP